MRVLLIHNRYRALGGEERAVTAQAELLERRGHQVELLQRDSAALGPARATRGLLTGGLEPSEVADRVRRLGADIVHAHNVHPTLGWRALAAAQLAGAATVLQLHNFRLFCAIGIAYRDGRPCHACTGPDTVPGLLHRCRGSLGEAAVYAAGLSAQQPKLLGCSDRLIALSEGHHALLRGHGLASERVSVVPNFVPESGWARCSGAGDGRHVLLAGRLVEEKGCDTAIRAAAAAGAPLVVAGDGPDRPRLMQLAQASGAEVTFTGWLSQHELSHYRRDAAVVMMPSRCEEAFGYGVLDAFAAGVPVIASPRGGLAEVTAAGGGTVLDPDRADLWASALAALWVDPERRALEGERALDAAHARYGEDVAYAALMAAYEAAIAGRREPQPGLSVSRRLRLRP